MSDNRIKFKRNYTIEDLEELLDNIPYEVYIKDVNGAYKYANKATVDGLGLNIEDVIGKSDYDLRSYEIAKVCSEGDKDDFKNGDKTLLNKNEKLLVGGIAKVIAEDNALTEITKKFKMIIDSMLDVYAIIQKVGNELRWIEISKRCNEIIGWSIEDLNSKDYREFIHPKDKNHIAETIEYGSKDKSRGSFTMKTKCNKWITIEAELNHLADDMYMIAAKDVTSLTKLEKDKESLKQAVEIESLKTEFFANLSHEFKTPLNIILSTVQVIMSYVNINKDYPDHESFNRDINSIKQNSYRLLKLANNMIDITKIDGDFYNLNIGNHNIVEVIENIVQSVAGYMNNNKRNIIFDTIEEEIITACDPEQIERIILNLLSNAMKFTKCGGNIYVNINISQECNKLIIKIGNDGQPINSKDSIKIFERFTQSENLLTRSIEGSGIGLSLAKSLVELHKGIIYVNTEIKEGTEFCIELPIRKIMNSKEECVREKSIVSNVEKFNIEFSDIYN